MSRHECSGLLFIVSAPSGAGKTSLNSALTQSDPNTQVSVSHTTRPQREGEVDGINYHFTNIETFQKMVKNDEFVEYAEVFGNFYGTSKTSLEEILQQGKNVILEIDWQGAAQVRQVLPEAISIFILPPSYQALETRLIGRADESDEVIKKRMQDALNQIIQYKEYDYVIINDDFQQALEDLRSIIRACDQDMRHQSHFYHEFAEKLIKQAN